VKGEMGIARLGCLLVWIGHVYASEKTWSQDHFVTGLPMTDGPELTSYAGLVPVRKDNGTEVNLE
jgi:hypothetical protein